MNIKKNYCTLVVEQATTNVPGFSPVYALFLERVTLDQCSQSLINNYGRIIANISLHFNRVPHVISVEEINSYLYRMTVRENQSISYFKHMIYALRHWFVCLTWIPKPLRCRVSAGKRNCLSCFRNRNVKH